MERMKVFVSFFFFAPHSAIFGAGEGLDMETFCRDNGKDMRTP